MDSTQRVLITINEMITQLDDQSDRVKLAGYEMIKTYVATEVAKIDLTITQSSIVEAIEYGRAHTASDIAVRLNHDRFIIEHELRTLVAAGRLAVDVIGVVPWYTVIA